MDEAKWEVDLRDDFISEYRALSIDVQDELLAHIALLEQFRPAIRAASGRHA
jgi:hypothetical protein